MDRLPTAKQIDHLRRLAQRTGMPAGTPKIRREASHRIRQLSSVGRLSGFERRLVADTAHDAPPASSFRRDEIAGYGADAHFRGRQ